MIGELPEVKRNISANEAIIHLVNSVNIGRMDHFYKWAEDYKETLAQGGEFYYRLASAIKQKPLRLMRLNELSSDMKKLITVNEDVEQNAYLLPEIEFLIDALLKEWRNAETYRFHNLGVRNKILLHGPTGNGKTTIARHIAQSAKLPFVEVNSDMVIDSHLGSTGGNIYKIFKDLKENCILFWDEIDGIGKRRGSTDSSAASSENERMINSMLINMEKMGADVVFIGATNRMEILDPAFIRRFDEIIEIKAPTNNQKIEFRDALGDYYKIPEMEWNSMDISSCKSYSDVKLLFVNIARNYVIKQLG